MNHHLAKVVMMVLGLRACTLFYKDKTDPERMDSFVKSVLALFCMGLGLKKDEIMLRKVVNDFLSHTGEGMAGSSVLVNIINAY